MPNESQIAYAMELQACIVKPFGYAKLREKIRIPGE